MSVPKSNSSDQYAIICDVIAYHLVHFVSIWLINKCQSGIDFIFTSNILKFYENIRAQSSISRKNTKMKVKLCKVYTLKCQQGDEIYFRNNKICEFHTLERQTWEWMNMQAHSRWPHAIRKGVITEKKKTWRKKIWKYAIVFASTQLRITRLRKYPIDPKAYLGRCLCIVMFLNLGHQLSKGETCGDGRRGNAQYMNANKMEVDHQLISPDDV